MDRIEHDDEFVAGVARHQVAAAQPGEHALGHFLQHLVTDVVTEAVVDVLEIIEVDEQDGEGARLGEHLLLRQAVFDAAQEGLAVGQTRSGGRSAVWSAWPGSSWPGHRSRRCGRRRRSR
jgi:hypothetical protein